MGKFIYWLSCLRAKRQCRALGEDTVTTVLTLSGLIRWWVPYKEIVASEP